MLRSSLELFHRFSDSSDNFDRFIDRLGMSTDSELSFGVRTETEHPSRFHRNDCVSFAARNSDDPVRFERFDATRFEDVGVVAETELAELV